jgi:hypothetical protein
MRALAQEATVERMASAEREIDSSCMFFAVDRHFGIGQDQQSNA